MPRIDAIGAGVRRRALTGGAVATAVWLLTSGGFPAEAHKAITSPYTYNEHVFPVLRERCLSCHFEGGPTPMSLATYRETLPWAETIREHLMAEKMPPWYVDRLGPPVRGGHALSTKEMDVLITWSVGGTPEGAGSAPPPVEPPPLQWSAGPPDLKLAMPAAHVVPAGTLQQTHEFTVPTGLKEMRWVKAVDLLPGERSMVRGAVISLATGPVLAVWVPGHDSTATPNGAAFRLPAGAELHVQMHYKKDWRKESDAVPDRSTIGLYFTDAPRSSQGLQALTVAAPADAGDSLNARTVSAELPAAARVYGVRPSFDRVYAAVDVGALLPDGRRTTLLKLRQAQPEWYRRYWLVDPIELPPGAKVEVTATPAPPDDFSIPISKRYPFEVAIEYVSLKFSP